MLTSSPIVPLTNKKLTAKLRSPTSPSAMSNDTQHRTSLDARGPAEAALDPLSQVCLHRVSSQSRAHANQFLPTCSISSKERTRRPPYTSYGPRTQSLHRIRLRARLSKRMRTRSRVQSRRGMEGHTKQTRSKLALSSDPIRSPHPAEGSSVEQSLAHASGISGASSCRQCPPLVGLK